jgi:hypothetical protein
MAKKTKEQALIELARAEHAYQVAYCKTMWASPHYIRGEAAVKVDYERRRKEYRRKQAEYDWLLAQFEKSYGAPAQAVKTV